MPPASRQARATSSPPSPRPARAHRRDARPHAPRVARGVPAPCPRPSPTTRAWPRRKSVAATVTSRPPTALTSSPPSRPSRSPRSSPRCAARRWPHLRRRRARRALRRRRHAAQPAPGDAPPPQFLSRFNVRPDIVQQRSIVAYPRTSPAGRHRAELPGALVGGSRCALSTRAQRPGGLHLATTAAARLPGVLRRDGHRRAQDWRPRRLQRQRARRARARGPRAVCARLDASGRGRPPAPHRPRPAARRLTAAHPRGLRARHGDGRGRRHHRAHPPLRNVTVTLRTRVALGTSLAPESRVVEDRVQTGGDRPSPRGSSPGDYEVTLEPAGDDFANGRASLRCATTPPSRWAGRPSPSVCAALAVEGRGAHQRRPARRRRAGAGDPPSPPRTSCHACLADPTLAALAAAPWDEAPSGSTARTASTSTRGSTASWSSRRRLGFATDLGREVCAASGMRSLDLVPSRPSPCAASCATSPAAPSRARRSPSACARRAPGREPPGRAGHLRAGGAYAPPAREHRALACAPAVVSLEAPDGPLRPRAAAPSRPSPSTRRPRRTACRPDAPALARRARRPRRRARPEDPARPRDPRRPGAVDHPLGPPAGQDHRRPRDRGALEGGASSSSRRSSGRRGGARGRRPGRARAARGRRTVLFIDEIHRFNRAQQDALLPHVESGTVTSSAPPRRTRRSPSTPPCSRAPRWSASRLAPDDLVGVLRRRSSTAGGASARSRSPRRRGPRGDRPLRRRRRGRAWLVEHLAREVSSAAGARPRSMTSRPPRATNPPLRQGGGSTTTSPAPSSRACAAATPTWRSTRAARMIEAGEDPRFVLRFA